MRKYLGNNSKVILLSGIILTIIFITSIIIILLIIRNNTNYWNPMLRKSLFLIAFGTCIGAHLLLGYYEKPNGKSGALCVTFYIIATIPIYIVLGIAFLMKSIDTNFSIKHPNDKNL